MFFTRAFDKPYIAVIGDIIRSKKLKNRDEVQKALRGVLDSVNQKYAAAIASNFMITLGDEFQGLLHDGEDLVWILHEIEDAMHPVQIRFGVGIGEITTEIDRNMPLGADGSAYYNARSMIEQIKSMKKKVKTNESAVRIASQNESAGTDMLLNALFQLSATIRGRWSLRQREIIRAYRISDCSQNKTAQKLGITQSSVQKGLSNAGFYAYKSAMDTAAKAFSEIKASDNKDGENADV